MGHHYSTASKRIQIECGWAPAELERSDGGRVAKEREICFTRDG